MVRTFKIKTASIQDTISLGRAIGRLLKPNDAVLMTGDLGTGKTVLAKGIVAAATGVDQDDVVSPSFTLLNRFEGAFPVHHADLYRLEGEQIDTIGLEEALDEGGALVIEWAEKLPEPDGEALRLFLSYSDEEKRREIDIHWREEGSWNERMETLHRELIYCPDIRVERGE